MDYFGDESGKLKGVLNGHCDVCVIGVVAGTKIDCMRCPKRTVRRVDDIPEAKWNDLLDTQKRRLFECFADQDNLQFGYSLFTRDKLQTMENYHLLYQDVNFPPAWDLALAGYAYGEILYEMGVPEERRSFFEFDRIASQKQSDAVVDHISHFVDLSNVYYNGSRQSQGIQAADCFAGAVAEDFKRDTDWKGYLDSSDIVECTHMSLLQLENLLSEY